MKKELAEKISRTSRKVLAILLVCNMLLSFMPYLGTLNASAEEYSEAEVSLGAGQNDSLFMVSFTSENYNYYLPDGGNTVKLTTILNLLGIDFKGKNIISAQSSNESLFVCKNDGSDWIVESLSDVSQREELTVNIDGNIYNIQIVGSSGAADTGYPKSSYLLVGQESVELNTILRKIGYQQSSDSSEIISVLSSNDEYFNAEYDAENDKWVINSIKQFSSEETLTVEKSDAVYVINVKALKPEGICGDNVVWELNDDGTLVISGSGPMYNYCGTYFSNMSTVYESPWMPFCDYITSAVIENGVTSIGVSSFARHTRLEQVSIGEDVSYIADYAFNFSSIKSVEVSNNVSYVGKCAFAHSPIESVSVAAHEIGPEAFAYNNNLTIVNVSSAIIGEEAFSDCVNLESLTLNEGVKEIGESAFKDCDSFTEVVLPQSLERVAQMIFEECDLIESVRINSELTSSDTHYDYPYGLFDNCANLKRVHIADGVNIPYIENAFTSCYNIEEIYIGTMDNTVKLISRALKKITVSPDNQYFSSVDGILFSKDGSTLVHYPSGLPRTYIIPDGVTGIADYAFWCGSPLNLDSSGTGTSFTVGEIHYWSGICSFDNDMQQIYVPDSVTSISDYAYYTSFTRNGKSNDLVYIKTNADIVNYEGTLIITASAQNGGSISPSGNVSVSFNESQNFDAAADTGYTFAGFTVDDTAVEGTDTAYTFSNVTSAHTILARFTPNTYTVRFDSNGGSGSMEDQTFTYDVSQNLRANSFTRTGYNFLGWATDPDASAASYADNELVGNLTANNNETVTLYAVWGTAAYNVTWLVDGTEYESMTVEYGAAVPSVANPVKESSGIITYTFDSWKDTEGKLENGKVVCDVILTAVFTESALGPQVIMTTALPVGSPVDFSYIHAHGEGSFYIDWGDGNIVEHNPFGEDGSYEIRGVTAGDTIKIYSANEIYWFALVDEMQLTSLDVTNCPQLEFLSCSDNLLTELDVTQNPLLESLYFYNNKITEIDLTNCPALKDLLGRSNNLETIDVSQNTLLDRFWCDNNKLTEIDISQNTLLTNFDCSQNQLTELDVSRNTNLTALRCVHNKLTQLDVSNNTALAELNCATNMITELDVSNNTALKEILCYENQLAELDLSQNTAIVNVKCRNNELTELDLTNNTALSTLGCEANQLTKLKLSSDMDLFNLFCADNQLKFSTLADINRVRNDDDMYYKQYAPQAVVAIQETVKAGEALDLSSEYDIDGTITVYKWYDETGWEVTPATSENGIFTFSDEFVGKSFYCTMTNEAFSDLTLTTTRVTVEERALPSEPQVIMTTALPVGSPLSLDVCSRNKDSYEEVAVYIDFGDGNLVEYDPSTWLGGLPAGETAGDTIKLYSFGEIYRVYCGYSQLTSLDVTNCPALSDLYCRDNLLTELDITQNPHITSLNVELNKIAELDVTNCPSLSVLICGANELEVLDVSKNPWLYQLHCSSNKLTELDVSNNTQLAELDCCVNLLGELDVANNTQLVSLRCGENELTELDVSNNPALVELFCITNQLTELDVSNNTALEYLWCYENQLTELDVSKNTKLINFGCADNQLTELDVTNNTALSTLSCSSNLLSTLKLSADTDLFSVECEDNQLKFSTLADINRVKNDDGSYFKQYAPQAVVAIQESVKAGEALDLSSEYDIDGTITVYTWYDAADDSAVTPATSENGVFTFSDEFVGKSLYCIMTNEAFSDLTLTTTAVKVEAADVIDIPTLDAPTNLYAYTFGYTSIRMTWKGVEEADGYEIFRCDRAGQPYNYVDTVSADAGETAYRNIGLSTGTTYYYKVRAYKTLEDGTKLYSEFSAYSSARPLPATPVVTAVRTSATTAKISWVKIYGATGYSVYRSTEENGEYTFVANLKSGDTTTYKATGLASAKTYYYKVRAYRQMGSDMMFGGYSKPAAAFGAPAAPVITARGVGYTSAKVLWEPVAGANGYAIYRCDAGGDAYSYITSVGADVTTYTNKNLSTGTTYYYKVRAYVETEGGRLYGNYSLCATARPLPATPVVTVTADDANNTTISWVRIYGATGYSVYRSTEKDGTYSFLAGISSGDTVSYTDKNLDEGVTYYYKVRAYRQMGSDRMFSEYSKPAYVK